MQSTCHRIRRTEGQGGRQGCFWDPNKSYEISQGGKYTQHELSLSLSVCLSLSPLSPLPLSFPTSANTLSKSPWNSVKRSYSKEFISYKNLGPFSSKASTFPQVICLFLKQQHNNHNNLTKPKWSKCTKLHYFIAFFHTRKGNAYEGRGKCLWQQFYIK